MGLRIGDYFADNWNSARTRRIRVMRLREFSTPELLAEVPIKDDIPTDEEWEKARGVIVGFVT